MTSLVTEKATKKNVWNARVVKVLAKKFGIGQWPFTGPGSEKKWYSMEENSPQGAWDDIAEQMLLEFTESGHPIFRATTPSSRCILKSKGHGKLSIHFTADCPTIETFFRIIISANQLTLYGAVANICEEFEAHQDRSGERDVLMGQTIVLSEIKAEVPLQNENPSHYQILWQQEERIKSLHKKAKWVNSVWSQDSHMLPKWDSISWQKTLVILDNFVPVTCTVNMELKLESGLWVKTVIILGSEFHMDQTNIWLIQITTTQKFLQI